MISSLAGIGGTLFPSRYLADRLHADAWWLRDDRTGRAHRHFRRWWKDASDACGPATGPRAIFDLVAMPLFGILGFRARDAQFEHRSTNVRLESPQGPSVGLVILPWAERPSVVWHDALRFSHAGRANWCFVLAPPFLSLVDMRGHATRRGIDFDLRALVDPQRFVTFWIVTAADAFEPHPRDPPIGAVRLDHLVDRAKRFQDRVRDDLQRGMEHALHALMRAVRQRPGQARSDSRLASEASRQFDEALTLAYRMLFLLFAESRALAPHDHDVYRNTYAVSTLCRDAIDGAKHPGLWEGLAAVTKLARAGCETRDLVATPFNGRLFSRSAAPSLEARRASRSHRGRETERDEALREALIALGSRQEPGGRQEISYRDLGVEQLGAVYERVLDLDPQEVGSRRPARTARSHSERRKRTGTFYTPQALADFLVRRTLAPLVAGMPSDHILSLRIVDPAMGSGAFLVAACRFLSAACETALVEEGRATPASLDDDARAGIRRLVAERCLVGVDCNPVAVQVARMSLWLATLAKGRPLSFLDHRLRVGDSLVGAFPSDLRRIFATGQARSHRPLPLFDNDLFSIAAERVVTPLTRLRLTPDDTVADVRIKEALWRNLVSARSPVRRWKLAAHLWCARWFWPGGPEHAPREAEVRALFDFVLRDDGTLSASTSASKHLATADKIAETHGFFHWPLEFADVFYDASGAARSNPGFDAVIGNPPWEMLRRTPAADASGRGPLVRFLRDTGIYASCATGHVNLYQPFVERALTLTRSGGRVGLVLPWGLATDDGSSLLRRHLMERSRVDTVVGFDNAEGLFPIHRGLRFMALTTTPGSATEEIRGRFGVRTSEEIESLPARDNGLPPSPYPVRLRPRSLAVIGGPALRVPDARGANDIALAERLASRFPCVGDAAGWGARFARELNATEDRPAFGRTGLPVLEGKHLAPFHVSVEASAFRIERRHALARLPDARFDRARLGYRDVSGVANRLSLIAAIIPPGAVTTHTVFCLRTPLALEVQHFLCALFNSYVLNWYARLLMGGHLTTSLVERLPVPRDVAPAAIQRIGRLAQRLAATHHAWTTAAVLQAEVARLYELDADEFRGIVAAFPLVQADERERAIAAVIRSSRAPRATSTP